MQLRSYMHAKIHKATVTCANLNYVGSVTIDKDLLDKTGMHVGEKVLIVDNTNGARLETYIIEGNRGSGAIEINGAAAHLVKQGDEVIIIAFALSDEPLSPKAILVDSDNRFVRYLDEKQGTVI
ncbi:MAG: aspartate 1-decarboxylase [Gammaproteobacteria bacterium]|nr:aspartate 1-decarboxylase [Gammaproteobacteria bacterium]